MFHRDLRVTIQQWSRDNRAGVAHGIAERSDDYCACAYVYCRDAQAVPRVDMKLATADIERRPYESPQPMEILMGTIRQ